MEKLLMVLTMVGTFGISYFLYQLIDQKKRTTEYIYVWLPMKKEWKALAWIVSLFLVVLVFGVACIYLIDINTYVYLVINGLVIGPIVNIAGKLKKLAQR